MARPSESPLGPKRQIAVTLTDEQRELLAQARERGWSKQSVVVEGLPIVQQGDVRPTAPYGTGRKNVPVRLAPEVIEALRSRAKALGCTHSQLVEACCRALLERGK